MKSVVNIDEILRQKKIYEKILARTYILRHLNLVVPAFDPRQDYTSFYIYISSFALKRVKGTAVSFPKGTFKVIRGYDPGYY